MVDLWTSQHERVKTELRERAWIHSYLVSISRKLKETWDQPKTDLRPIKLEILSSWSHPEVILKSSWSHPDVILKSSWSEVILNSSRSHPEVILKSSGSHPESWERLKESWQRADRELGESWDLTLTRTRTWPGLEPELDRNNWKSRELQKI